MRIIVMRKDLHDHKKPERTVCEFDDRLAAETYVRRRDTWKYVHRIVVH